MTSRSLLSVTSESTGEALLLVAREGAVECVGEQPPPVELVAEEEEAEEEEERAISSSITSLPSRNRCKLSRCSADCCRPRSDSRMRIMSSMESILSLVSSSIRSTNSKSSAASLRKSKTLFRLTFGELIDELLLLELLLLL